MYYKKILKVFLLVNVFCLLLAQSCFAENPNFIKAYNKGLQAYKAKDCNLAVENFNIALKYNPKSYRTYLLLGLSYGSKGNLKKAEDAINKAIKIDPDNWEAYILLGHMNRAVKNYPAAYEYYSKALSLPSLKGNDKQYYINLVKKMEEEQNKTNDLSLGSNPSQDRIIVNLDSQKWQKVLEAGNKNDWIIEYGLKGQDVKHYDWTELVTIQGSSREVFQAPLENYFSSLMSIIEKTSKNTTNSFKKNIISQTPIEIVFEWSSGEGKESDVGVFKQTDKSIYRLTYAKKGIITPEERTKWLNILKTFQINE